MAFDSTTGTIRILGINNNGTIPLHQSVDLGSIPTINTCTTGISSTYYEDLNNYMHNRMDHEEHFQYPAPVYSKLNISSDLLHQSCTKRHSLSPASTPTHCHARPFSYRSSSEETPSDNGAAPWPGPRRENGHQVMVSPLPLSPRNRFNTIPAMGMQKAASLEHLLSPKVSSGPTLPPRNISPKSAHHTGTNKSVSFDSSSFALPSRTAKRTLSCDQPIVASPLQTVPYGQPSPYMTSTPMLKKTHKSLSRVTTSDSTSPYCDTACPYSRPISVALPQDQASPYSTRISISTPHDLPNPYSTPVPLLHNRKLPPAKMSSSLSQSSEDSTGSEACPYSTPVLLQSSESQQLSSPAIAGEGAQSKLEEGCEPSDTSDTGPSPDATTTGVGLPITPCEAGEAIKGIRNDAAAADTSPTKKLSITKQMRIFCDSELTYSSDQDAPEPQDYEEPAAIITS